MLKHVGENECAVLLKFQFLAAWQTPRHWALATSNSRKGVCPAPCCSMADQPRSWFVDGHAVLANDEESRKVSQKLATSPPITLTRAECPYEWVSLQSIEWVCGWYWKRNQQGESQSEKRLRSAKSRKQRRCRCSSFGYADQGANELLFRLLPIFWHLLQSLVDLSEGLSQIVEPDLTRQLLHDMRPQQWTEQLVQPISYFHL